MAGVNLFSGGSITNLSDGLITSSAGAGLDFYLNHGIIPGADAMVVNYGTIAGAAGKDAVHFLNNFYNLLVDEAGAVFTGKVDGSNAYGGSYYSTLELSAAAGKGTLSGLGTNFVNFQQINIDKHAIWELTGNNYEDAAVTITNAGALELDNADLVNGGPSGGIGQGTLINNGVILLDPSTLSMGALLGTGSVTLGASGMVIASGTVGSGERIVFNGGNGVLQIDKASAFAGTIASPLPTDVIDLTGVTYHIGNHGSVAGGTLTILDAGNSQLAHLAVSGVADGTTALVNDDGGGGTAVQLCFLAGTRIHTPAGQITVESLAVGDMVITASGASRPITWIGKGRVLATPGRRNAATPVLVCKGAIANNVPSRDLYVTKGHSLFIDGVLIPVEYLVNHRSIIWDDHAREVELYHVELETHDVLIANGTPAESYRDDGNRWLFQNSNEAWDRELLAPCAPLLTGGPVVDAIWSRLLDRSGPRPGLPQTDDADLHLMVEGKRVDGVAHPDGVVVFNLPIAPQDVRLVSRAGVPQELGLARDDRLLGVAVSRLTVSQGRTLRSLDADDTALCGGFHPFEAGDALRWTNGDAVVPSALLAGLHGPCRLEVAVACMTRYPLTEADDTRLVA